MAFDPMYLAVAYFISVVISLPTYIYSYRQYGDVTKSDLHEMIILSFIPFVNLIGVVVSIVQIYVGSERDTTVVFKRKGS